MKVLYIGHYKEDGGWATAATSQILALDHVGVDVVCRNITLTQDRENVHPRILELEAKDTADCTHLIQHILPHHLVGTDKFKKNIVFTELESTSIKHVAWFEHLQLGTEVWVPNRRMKEHLSQDGIDNKSIHVVHHPCDENRYKKKYEPIHIDQSEGKFKFYYIGDLNDRKNLDSMIRCFHSEFNPSEPVCFILKVRKFGHSSDQLRQIMDQKIFDIKSKLRMYRNITDYHNEITITEDITDDQICALHQYGDCFVSATHGEAWSIPTFDAAAFGNYVITSDHGGPQEFITASKAGHKIMGDYTVCECTDAAFPFIFTGRENWFVPSEPDIKKAMRFAFTEYTKNPIKFKQERVSCTTEMIRNFSYYNVGKRMKELLENE